MKDFIILLIEQEVSSGHWVSIFRTGPSNYIYFNSYGKKYDTDLSLISRLSNKILGNEYNSIKKLKMPNDTITWNSILYQGKTSAVCGRYCVSFVRKMRDGYDLNQYQTFLWKAKKEGSFKSYDETILSLTHDV